MTNVVISDIEANGLHPDKLWCVVAEGKYGLPKVFRRPDLNPEPLIEYASKVDYWVFHNGLKYDWWVLNKLVPGLHIPHHKIIDTFVCSRLFDYRRFRTHGLEEIGQHFGYPKPPIHDWSEFSEEIVDRCKADVIITKKFYYKYIEGELKKPYWKKALRLEHDTAIICQDMQNNGFKFDVENAEAILEEIKSDMKRIEEGFKTAFPDRLVEVNRLKYRKKQDGELFSNVQKALDTYPVTEVQGEELVCFDYESFNPRSSKHRVERLWDAGWEPVDRTTTHQKFSRVRVGAKWGKIKSLTQKDYDAKKAQFATYGWTVSEENLQTLPETAPQGAKDLAVWLTLEGRKSDLEEWLGVVKEDGRIHPSFWSIGAWTQRKSHSGPNCANIFSVFHGEPKTPVDQVKLKYDERLRALWIC